MNSQDIKDVLEVSRILGGYGVDINEAETVAALITWKNNVGIANGTPAPKARRGRPPKASAPAAPEPAPEPPQPPVTKARTNRQPAPADDSDF